MSRVAGVGSSIDDELPPEVVAQANAIKARATHVRTTIAITGTPTITRTQPVAGTTKLRGPRCVVRPRGPRRRGAGRPAARMASRGGDGGDSDSDSPGEQPGLDPGADCGWRTGPPAWLLELEEAGR